MYELVWKYAIAFSLRFEQIACEKAWLVFILNLIFLKQYNEIWPDMKIFTFHFISS